MNTGHPHAVLLEIRTDGEMEAKTKFNPLVQRVTKTSLATKRPVIRNSYVPVSFVIRSRFWQFKDSLCNTTSQARATIDLPRYRR